MRLAYVISNFNSMEQGYSEISICSVRQELTCALWKSNVPNNYVGSQLHTI
jgi:hypothetical protein